MLHFLGRIKKFMEQFIKIILNPSQHIKITIRRKTKQTKIIGRVALIKIEKKENDLTP